LNASRLLLGRPCRNLVIYIFWWVNDVGRFAKAPSATGVSPLLKVFRLKFVEETAVDMHTFGHPRQLLGNLTLLMHHPTDFLLGCLGRLDKFYL